MRKEWTSMPLDELCDFKNGLWKGKKAPFVHVGVIRNTNFTKNGRLDDSDIAYLDVEAKQFSTRKLEYGDLILEKSGGGPKQPVGRVIPFEIKEGDFSFSNFTSVIRIKNSQDLDYSFLHKYLHFLYLSGATEGMQKYSTNIRNLQLKEYKNITVPLPPLEEQKRIVAILDEAFAGIETAIANTEKNLANARELFESYLATLFNKHKNSWAMKRLGDLTDVQSGGTPLKSNKEYWGGDIAWYSSGELNHLYTDEPRDRITRLGLSESNAKLFPAGTLLIGMYDTAALKMSILDREAAFNQAVAGLRPTKGLDLRFVMFAITAIKPMVLGLRRGVRQKNLSLRKIKDIKIAIPGSEEQKRVADEIISIKDEVVRLEKSGQQKLTALAELKQSLLQKAFSGELTADKAEDEVQEAVA